MGMVLRKKMMANMFNDRATMLRPRTNHKFVFGKGSFNRAAESSDATSDTAGSSPRIGITTRNVNTSLKDSGERIFEIIHIATTPTVTNRALDMMGFCMAHELVLAVSRDSSSKSIAPQSKKNQPLKGLFSALICVKEQCIKRFNAFDV